MSDPQIAAIQNSLTEIKICVARLDEREAARSKLMELQSTRMDYVERKLSNLDKKVAAAIGMVALISYGLQLLVPNI
jgi:hypothetical protein|tara:strand:- start:208 stop:438 length:231 start_codon:yes stop_codon:yes gene_type:complete